MNELMITSRITKIKYKPTLLQQIFGIPESEELPVFERSCHGFYEIPSTSIEYEKEAQYKAQKDAEIRARGLGRGAGARRRNYP